MFVHSLRPDQIEAFRAQLAAPDGLQTLAYLKALSLEGDPDTIPAEVSRAAEQNGWTIRRNGRAALTRLGQIFADASREYVNWVGDGCALPLDLIDQAYAEKRILDVGCGWGRYLLSWQAMGAQPVGLDYHPAYLQLSTVFAERESKPPPQRVCGNGSQIPFQNGAFDLLFCIRALNFMHFHQALGEFARVLAPGGQLVLAIATLSNEHRRWKRRGTRRWYPRSVVGHFRMALASLVMQRLRHRILSSGRDPLSRPMCPTGGFLDDNLAGHGLDRLRAVDVPGDVEWLLYRKRSPEVDTRGANAQGEPPKRALSNP